MEFIVCGEISGKQYNKLLKFAIDYSDSFGVSTFKIHKKHLQPTYFSFFEKMAPYEKNKDKHLLPQHYEKGQKFYVYELNDIGEKYLIQQNSFWDWSIPNLPEDLSFFKEKKVWLNCITHEKMILINSDDIELLHFLTNIGIQIRAV